LDGSESGERIIAHLAFARAVAARSLDTRCRGADREDLIAWGVVGLVQAAQRYRGDLGASFGAYAARRVRGQVLDALRERDPLTRSARRAYREAQRIAEDLPPPYVEISLDRLAELGDGGIAAPDAVAATGTRRDPRWDCVARQLRALSKLERRVDRALVRPRSDADARSAFPWAFPNQAYAACARERCDGCGPPSARRRRPRSATARVANVSRLRQARFARLVARALDDLPAEFREQMRNIEIVVEDEPSPEQLRGDGELLGLYEGVPLTDRGAMEPYLPDRISIFRGPIERISASPRRRPTSCATPWSMRSRTTSASATSVSGSWVLVTKTDVDPEHRDFLRNASGPLHGSRSCGLVNGPWCIRS
jgi:RNA polymerase sigma factor (sigma-70 family)